MCELLLRPRRTSKKSPTATCSLFADNAPGISANHVEDRHADQSGLALSDGDGLDRRQLLLGPCPTGWLFCKMAEGLERAIAHLSALSGSGE